MSGNDFSTQIKSLGGGERISNNTPLEAIETGSGITMSNKKRRDISFYRKDDEPKIRQEITNAPVKIVIP